MLSYTANSLHPTWNSPSVMPSWGRSELPTIGAICLHDAVALPSVSSAGSAGEASWQSNKPLLFSQMAAEMAHHTPGNAVLHSWDHHEPWMKGQKYYAVSLHYSCLTESVVMQAMRRVWHCEISFLCRIIGVEFYNKACSMFLKRRSLVSELARVLFL